MTIKASHPKDLARAVSAQIKRRRRRQPPLELLTNLFQEMYFASLLTEESEPIHFHIVYLDPSNPDPSPPKRIVKDRWSFVRLGVPIRLSASNLVKIAKASDPRTSSFAVYPDSDARLLVWGLIDQQNRYHDFLNYDSSSGPERPGLFHADVVGPGHLAVTIGYQKVAELRIDTLLGDTIDILHGGPIYRVLLPGIASYLATVENRVPPEILLSREESTSLLVSDWIESLCRLLLRVQSLRHGGALIMLPSPSVDDLNVKYRIKYDRLRTALEEHAYLSVQKTFAEDQIHELLDEDADDIPTDLHLDESIYGFELEETESEINGAIWFIALLTRVDGAVVLTPTLDVRGFGAEITDNEVPDQVAFATNQSASKRGLRKADYNHFGTRHRSMMRYCFKHPGSIGFVISQDGDVRVITRLHDRSVVWENIRLQGFSPLSSKS